MDDNTKFPPVVDLSTRTELRWSNPQQPIAVGLKGSTKSTSTGWAKEQPAPSAELSPYPDKEA